MARRYRLSRRAIADLEQIADDIRSHNPTAAKKVLKALQDSFQFVATNPRVGTSREDLRPGLRFVIPSRPANNYVVFFYPTANGIEVSDVIHAARNWADMFIRGER